MTDLWIVFFVITIIILLLTLVVLFFILKKLSAMSNQNPLLPVYHFQVQWGGTKIGFTEVSGLDIHFEPIAYRQGADAEPVTRWIPGLTKYSNITLKRGVAKGDNDFFKWMNSRQGSSIERRDISIQLLDEQHQPVVDLESKKCVSGLLHGARIVC